MGRFAGKFVVSSADYLRVRRTSGRRDRDTSNLKVYVYISTSSFLPEKESITCRTIGIARRANREMVLALSGVGYCNAALSPPSFVSSLAPFVLPPGHPPPTSLPFRPLQLPSLVALPFDAILHLFPATCAASLSSLNVTSWTINFCVTALLPFSLNLSLSHTHTLSLTSSGHLFHGCLIGGSTWPSAGH